MFAEFIRAYFKQKRTVFHYILYAVETGVLITVAVTTEPSIWIFANTMVQQPAWLITAASLGLVLFDVLEAQNLISLAGTGFLGNISAYGSLVFIVGIATLFGRRFSIMAEFRDPETGEHIKRVGLYIKILVDVLGLSDEDVYDALRSKRPYKPEFDHPKVLEIMTKGDNRLSPEQFDPQLLQIFVRRHEAFDRVYERFRDRPAGGR